MTSSRTALLVHPSDEGYGADRVLLMVAEALYRHGWAVVVLLPADRPRGWLSTRLRDLGATVERGPLAAARRRDFRLTGLARFAVALVRARRFVRRVASAHAASVIHINTTALLVGALIGRPHSARMVWHVHEIVRRPRLIADIFRVAPIASADRVIAVSDAVRGWLTAVPFGGARVIRLYNGIDAGPAPRRRRSASPVVAFVGRLNRWKGVELFIDAAATVASRHPEATFRIIGDPPPGEEWRAAALTQRAAAHGLGDRLSLEGYRDDIPAVLESVDVLIVPSLWPEPFGLVIAEGMRARCAVIAADHGAAPELLEHGQCGVLVAPGDIDALAGALDSLLDDPALRDRLGSAARERVVTTFGREAFERSVLTLYSELLA